MKKVNDEKLTLILTLTREDVLCRASYEVSSEDLLVKRSYDPALTPTQKAAIKRVAKGVLRQIKETEGLSDV